MYSGVSLYNMTARIVTHIIWERGDKYYFPPPYIWLPYYYYLTYLSHKICMYPNPVPIPFGVHVYLDIEIIL